MRSMPIPRPPLRAWLPALGAAALGFVLTARAAQTPASAAAAPAKAATNAAPAEPEVTLSVFTQEGRDPFFPQSTRRQKVQQLLTNPTNPVPSVAIAELELKGISGSAGHLLASINNRTFETGVEGTVASNVGRVRLTCKEIRPDSVRVLLNGTERTLTLRPH
jgi:hypothetical protein